MARTPRFRFLGWQDGWYVLRLQTRNQPALEMHAFKNTVLEWLIEQDIIPNTLSYLANGNTGDGPVVPAMADGSALCLLFRRPADVLRFERKFGGRNITPETMFTALRAEASVHKFILADLVRIAYDAVRRLILVFGDTSPHWDDTPDDEQQFFLQSVQEYLEHPEWPAARLHEAWVDRRLMEGWRYASEIDLDNRRHPLMVPFTKLSEREQGRIRLTTSVIVALAPLLRR